MSAPPGGAVATTSSVTPGSPWFGGTAFQPAPRGVGTMAAASGRQSPGGGGGAPRGGVRTGTTSPRFGGGSPNGTSGGRDRSSGGVGGPGTMGAAPSGGRGATSGRSFVSGGTSSSSQPKTSSTQEPQAGRGGQAPTRSVRPLSGQAPQPSPPGNRPATFGTLAPPKIAPMSFYTTSSLGSGSAGKGPLGAASSSPLSVPMSSSPLSVPTSSPVPFRKQMLTSPVSMTDQFFCKDN